MFTYGIRNIVHKQSDKNINILYYPINDLIDDIITDWDANFFIPNQLSSNKIKKNNIIYLNNISIFEYDFIFTYEISNDILDLSAKLHLPILVYLRYGSYDDSKIQDYKNVFYIVEHAKESEQDKLLAICPNIHKKVINKENNICLFINNNNDYGNLVQILRSKIENLSIVDEEKINQEAMLEILSKHKICIDLYPRSIYKMLFCAKNNLPYITVANNTTIKYKNAYDGIHFIEQNIDALLNLFKTLLSNNISYNNTLITKNSSNTTKIFIEKIKRKGLVL